MARELQPCSCVRALTCLLVLVQNLSCPQLSGRLLSETRNASSGSSLPGLQALLQPLQLKHRDVPAAGSSELAAGAAAIWPGDNQVGRPASGEVAAVSHGLAAQLGLQLLYQVLQALASAAVDPCSTAQVDLCGNRGTAQRAQTPHLWQK